MISEQQLKRDAFGAIYLCRGDQRSCIRRDLRQVRWWLRPFAAAAAAKEARALRRLDGIDGVPALLHAERLLLERGLIEGAPM